MFIWTEFWVIQTLIWMKFESEPGETSWARDNYEENEDDEFPDEPDENHTHSEGSEKQEPSKKSIIVKPHQKRKVVRSQTQTISCRWYESTG